MTPQQRRHHRTDDYDLLLEYLAVIQPGDPSGSAVSARTTLRPIQGPPSLKAALLSGGSPCYFSSAKLMASAIAS
jgi:hypothetical protein